MREFSKMSSLMAGLIAVSFSLQAKNPDNNISGRKSHSLNENAVFFPLAPPEDKQVKFILYVSEGILNIKYPKPQELMNGEVIIYNLLGKEVIRKRLDPDAINQVNLPAQTTCYIVRINYSGKVHTQRIIVTK